MERKIDKHKYSDELWLMDAVRHGWSLRPVVWWKRLPAIRFIRSAWAFHQASEFREMTAMLGLGVGGIPQGDMWYIYGIRRGFEPVVRKWA